MEDPKLTAFIYTAFFIAIAAIPSLIIAVPAARKIPTNGISAARLPLATMGLIVGIVSYALLYATLAISIAMQSQPTLVPAAMALAVSLQLVEATAKASVTSGQALLFIPCLSGITAATSAILTAAVLTMIRHIQQNP